MREGDILVGGVVQEAAWASVRLRLPGDVAELRQNSRFANDGICRGRFDCHFVGVVWVWGVLMWCLVCLV